MSANLSKNDLLAIFEEIKQEQETQFPLSERFIKQLFKPHVLSKAKEYHQNGQINWLEHNSDFSVIDASMFGNEGNTFTQHIEISKLPSGFSVDSHCTCGSKTKCRHIAAVLLKLKIEHSGDYGEDYIINDWFSELKTLKQVASDNAKQVLLFVLDVEKSVVTLTPKIANYDAEHNYTLGRNLTEQQLNSFVTPTDLLESDFRLYSWIRSQNALGKLELKGQWGFAALQQLIATQRLFLGRSRQAIKADSMQALEFDWKQNKDLTSLSMTLAGQDNWLLLKTTPPTYLDPEKLKVGRIRTPLTADEIALLANMPAIHTENFDRVYQQLNDNFGEGVIPHAFKESKKSLARTVFPVISINNDEGTIRLGLQFNYQNSLYDLSQAPADILNQSLENTVVNELTNLGFELCKGALQTEFIFNKQSVIHEHWLKFEIIPNLLKRGWKINDELAVGKVLKQLSLQVERGKGHQIVSKIVISGVKTQQLFVTDNNTYQSLNRQSERFYYFTVGKRFAVVEKAAMMQLNDYRERFEHIKTRDEILMPLSFLPKLIEQKAIKVNIVDDALDAYLAELNSSQQLIKKSDIQGLNQGVQLREYQQHGVDWLNFLKRHQLGGILADDMGLGKTLQVIAFLANAKQSPQAGPTLIVCPTSLVGNWQSEINKFASNLKITTVFGAARSDQLQQLSQADCILTTYPLLKRDIAFYSPLYFENIILDEAQYIKNDAAQVSRLVKRLNADFKLCLSGTPIENNLFELKSLLDFAMPSLLGSQAHFKSYFQTPIERDNDVARADELKSLIMPFILRRTKAQVTQELPEKTELVKEFEFESKQKEIYNGITESLEQKLVDLFAQQGVQKSKLAFLDALLKLRQICCHPKLIDPSSQAGSAKLEWLSKHLPIMLSEGRKVIIFSQFTMALDVIAERLNELGISFSMLTGQTRHRDRVIEEFTQGDTSVFLISLKAGGTGLNLTQADTVIHFDPWWNPAVEKQATDRAYRIGQTNPVFVYKLIMANSIEQKVFKMQQHKQALVDALFTEKSMSFTQFDEEQMLALIKN
ncbi:DEAD/DEAH box helicase [Pseudoalteromonas sp. B5MOD-1]|uniref:DEAD/DEAH box helicase n=1 Tax=Pseudoalteromonas TaxID=53246 RepID=UPI0007854768|nr:MULTISPECIES: DEAD/DEAH box helicase [Pseudoalteromonas]MCO7205595.1 DEAD/DEAH box helicase [Pseudoalteromonas sp. CnMc7-37]MCZ4252310.1 DEAD/DEAH box helicase [Pseudoalteromonas shioyasakiensis]RZF78556.1 DEAD/DEAH box helicase [Pseudoalteromonas sp. CO109Y]TMO35025.1 ATP-dependent helicase [Pseudoalteromonas sp. S4491]TMO41005.1 ATP-dependent helicase [Pseudoalteromonas sp. S4488]